jgi:ABC-type Fe3+ transport system permease subunit
VTSAVRVTRRPLAWPDFAALAIVAAILAVVVLVPAAALVARALESAPSVEAASSRGLPELAPAATTAWALLARSLAWSVCAATAGALLGWAAARRALHWRSRAWRGAVACVLVLPIALPPWLLYAGLWLSIGPGTPIGDLAARADAAPSLRAGALAVALTAWSTAPAFAMFLARGASSARDRANLLLDGAGLRARVRAAFARDGRLLLAAILATSAFLLCETAIFDLALVPTYGFELRSLEALGASPRTLVTAALPAIALAVLAVALIPILAGGLGQHGLRARSGGAFAAPVAHRGPAAVASASSAPSTLALVLAVACVAVPVLLFLRALTAIPRAGDFFLLHGEALRNTLVVATVAAVVVTTVALLLRVALASGVRAVRGGAFALAGIAAIASLVPGALVAASMGLGYNRDATALIYDTPAVVVFVLSVRALLIAAAVAVALEGASHATARANRALDGRSLRARWLGLRAEAALVALAALPLSFAWSLGELTASSRVLPPGFEWIATDILNAIHFQRPETVLLGASALIVVALLAAVALASVLGRFASRGALTAARALALLALLPLAACGGSQATNDSDAPTLAGREGGGPGEFDAPVVARPLEVVRTFSGVGRGRGQFNGPRVLAIDAAPSTAWVIDKDGRAQCFDAGGAVVAEWRMPSTKSGKPVGASIAPDGTFVIADTHEHRIAAHARDGALLWTVGSYGLADAEFIYPTDIAFAPDGRMFVAEYGSNDRIQVFSREGSFLYRFGAFGDGEGQFMRPQAIAYDAERDELYIVDAGNHRVQVLTGDGEFRRSLGSAGREAGQFAYPFGIVLEIDGQPLASRDAGALERGAGAGRRTIVVAEHGNHRVQRLDGETGEPLAMAGGLGTSGGRLKYPWALEFAGRDADGTPLFAVCDHANSRIVFFRFPYTP